MVSIRSLTPPFCPRRGRSPSRGRSRAAAPLARTGCGRTPVAALGRDQRDVVPPRPAPRPTTPPCSRRCADGGRSCRCSSLDPALWGPAGRAAARLPAGLAARARRRARRAVLRVAAVRGDPVAPRGRRPRRRSAPSEVHVAADFGPYGARARRGGRAGARGTPASTLVRTGSPYAVAPGRVAQRLRHALPGLHAVLPRVERPRLATPRSTRRRGAAWLRLDEGTDRIPEPATCRRPRRCPRPARRRPSARWEEFLDARRRLRRPTATGPTSTAPSGCRSHLKWGEIHPRTLLADLGASAQQGRADLPQRAGVARVLRRRAAPQPGLGARRTTPGVRADGLRRARRRSFERLAGGPHRLPDRRRRACASCAPPAGCTTGCG